MFSYLRPHRRAPSTPTSPVPEQAHSWEPSAYDHAHPPRHDVQDSPTSSFPPSLPPIPRVSSVGFETVPKFGNSKPGLYSQDNVSQQWDVAKGDTRGMSSHSYTSLPVLAAASTQRPESAGGKFTKHTSFQNTRLQSGFIHEVPTRQAPQPPSEKLTSPALAGDPQSRSGNAGRRPTGVRTSTLPSPNLASVHEPVPSRSGKARLNLLNPMSLLARRRTSQAVTQLSPESTITPRTDDYSTPFVDPRIRGTVVHDFSAPRGPRRNASYTDAPSMETTNFGQSPYQRSPNPQYAESNSDENANSPWSGGNHTPVFTENFEEEQYPAAGPHVRRASDLSDLSLPKLPYARGVSKPVDQSTSPKSNESSPQHIQPSKRISDQETVFEVGPPVPPKTEDAAPQPRRISIDPAATPPKATKNSKRAPSRNVSGVSTKDGFPRHMKSTSSRFSFDMVGAAKQERLLEDRHRQKELEKQNEKGDEDGEDDFDYDEMMNDDGLEERIPGVNAELDEDDLEDMMDDGGGFEESKPGVNAGFDEKEEETGQYSQDLAAFMFQRSALTSPLSSDTPGVASTPRDVNGEAIGFAFTKDSPYLSMTDDSSLSSPLPTADKVLTTHMGLEGLGLQGIEASSSATIEIGEINHVNLPSFAQASGIDDDDLYFDDGIIDGIGDRKEGQGFDESVFDNVDTDQYGRPLRPLPTLYSPPSLRTGPLPSFTRIPEAIEDSVPSPDISDSATSSRRIPPAGALAPKPSVIGRINSSNVHSQSLTQDSLAAYQSALAAAAHAAAASGKFDRRTSAAFDALSPSSQDEHQPGLIPDSSQASHYEPFSPSYELEDDFDYDDALEDDPIIAAANAEALANDPDGFYGQEFGFYSAPAASEAEYVNGGYFGPRGPEGVYRSTSGRIAGREPNLTPITERSEYSNRNSFMSLSLHGQGSITSPGLAQLAGMLNDQPYEGDMSMNSLLKLRRGAWGGSQASLHSSTGSPRSAAESPVNGLSPWAQQDNTNRHRKQNSSYSIGALSEESSSGEQSDEVSLAGSPTLTLSTSTPLPLLSTSFPPQNAGSMKSYNTSPVKDHAFVKKHRPTGSAESISYLKEDDPLSPTGERWVLERRRTAESGEIILGREVVSGGRI